MTKGVFDFENTKISDSTAPIKAESERSKVDKTLERSFEVQKSIITNVVAT